MSNILKAFDHGKAFIPFITCGDPDLDTTAAAVRARYSKASTASSSVIGTYSARPVSWSQACSGPMPG